MNEHKLALKRNRLVRFFVKGN